MKEKEYKMRMDKLNKELDLLALEIEYKEFQKECLKQFYEENK